MEDQRDHIVGEASLKRRVKALEKRIIENEEARLKYPNQPEKFVESEVNLDEEIGLCSGLAAFPNLMEQFQDLGGLASLISLLAHANPDIAARVVSVLMELFDPEVINEMNKSEDVRVKTVDYIFEEFDIMALLGDLLLRLEEHSSSEDFQAVSNVLQTIDHLRELRPLVTISELLKSGKILNWVLNRISTADGVDYNALFCAELLSSILQNSPEACLEMGKSGPESFNCVDKILVAFSKYKKKDWATPEEEEFVMNLKNAMISLLFHPENRDELYKSQGVHLMVRILRERTKMYPLALKVIEMSVIDHADNATAFVQANGLSVLLGIFAGKSSRCRPGSLERRKEMETVLSILAHLCDLCQGDEQGRLIFKFFEDNCVKLKRLCALLVNYYQEEQATCREFQQEFSWTPLKDYTLKESANEQYIPEPPSEIELLDDSVYDERLEMGLLSLQLICRILLRLTDMGNDILSAQVHVLLEAKEEQEGETETPPSKNGQRLMDLWAQVLREYADHLRSAATAGQRKWTVRHLALQESQHEHYLRKAEGLRTEAETAQAAAERKKAEEAQAQADEERRQRNKRRKVLEKMRKFDRELERREELEEYRWNRKHGVDI